MENVDLNKIKFALDVGTRSLIATVGVVYDNKFKVICEKYLEHEERAMIDGQIHDIDLVAKVVKKLITEIEDELNIKLKEVSIAAAGRFLRTVNSLGRLELSEDEVTKQDIKSLELVAVKEAESKINKNTEGKLYCVGYSVKNYFLNGYVISNLIGHKGESAEVEVIATFLPRSVIDSLYTVMKKVNLKVNNITLEPIAAIEAVVPKKLRLLNIALVDIGAGTSDIAISSKESISSYGMVPQAGDEITEIIAEECLVDFNTAEEIKRNLSIQEKIKYIDILGIENIVKSEDILKVIKPAITKIAEAIANKIIELNGNKSPSALFLVGGGAHTPGIIEELSLRLNMPIQRIAIKDRESIENCIANNNLGSAGVTVIGIALAAMKNNDNDFIEVTLNDSNIAIFNSNNNTVMDVIISAGISPNNLISKNGKNIRYKLNGVKRLSFGEKAKHLEIRVNGVIEGLDKLIKSGDKIDIEYAKDGLDANPKIKDILKEINSISIFINNDIISLEPIILVNNKNEDVNYEIKENDDINIIFPNSIENIKKYILKDNINIMKNNEILNDSYIVKEGEKLYTKIKEENINKNEAIKEINLKDSNDIKVLFNNKECTLKGQKDYIFVDIFKYVDFDLTIAKGIINLYLNGIKAGYTDKLKDGDSIEVFWS